MPRSINLSSYLDPSYTEPAIAFCLLIVIAIIANFGVKRLLLKGVERLVQNTSFGQDQELRRHAVIKRAANVIPLIVISAGVKAIPGVPPSVASAINIVTQAAIILSVALVFVAVASIVDVIYHRREDRRQSSLKGYFQLGKIIIYAIAAILIVAVLTGRSPTILLSSLGAMAAVLMLVFQDTILSFVAALQISSNDVVRQGDWISMPSVGADGDVIEIGLHMVKVRNFDKTITSIPTRKLATESFANWRGMQESGGRRIKRSIHIDQHSIRFLDEDDLKNFAQMALLRDYIAKKATEIENWNESLGAEADNPANTRRQTNIGLLRAYLKLYLKSHPGIHQHMTLMVRQMESGPTGVPLEIYCFTNTTAWAAYEGIQSDIFDHILATLPEFDLAVFQQLAGTDIRGARRKALKLAA
ncbi:mechanosensitive ion channel family protein [Pontibaca salina]|uniref:Mechanosensitive ion channel n=1 Tax=Pontibaca salina TaxID=2795731 RepID=A0A934HRB5_9RHOB|nr:mechanosensitive ion channel domain-containing protein [Pontibaca salina]MBI6628778.1 mechanosensitive ion channel [Pontibaca salina]